MKIKTESAPLRFARSIAIGVLLSMLIFYSVHVFGKWEIENYRPDAQTTSTLLLHNTCAIFDLPHTLRPNTGVSDLSDGINGTKLSASFMNFFDGHVVGMIILSLTIGVVVFACRNMMRKNREARSEL